MTWSTASSPVGIPTTSTWVALAIGAAGTVTMAAGLAALSWFGMWMGLNSKNTSLATLKTFLFVKVIPVFAVNFAAGILSAVLLIPSFMKASAASTPGSKSVTVGMTTVTFPLLLVWISAVLNLAIDLGLILWSRKRLRASLRALASRDIRPVWVPPPLPPPTPQSPATALTPPEIAPRS
jgi:hypothetical protein